jgi:hypothetical protein
VVLLAGVVCDELVEAKLEINRQVTKQSRMDPLCMVAP